MNPMIKKLVDTGFMNEAAGQYLEDAVMRKESVIITGHKGYGILPLMATLGTVAKAAGSTKQVKASGDLSDASDCYLVGDLKLTDDFTIADYEQLIADTIAIPGSSIITIKDPDHPYSLNKVLGDVFKKTGDNSKVFQVAECYKVGDEKRLKKLTKMTLNEKGRAVKADFDGPCHD